MALLLPVAENTATKSTLNPRAATFAPSEKKKKADTFSPTEPTPTWTWMNRPLHNTLCRFHSHEAGNRCYFGLSCQYGHALELHRPTYAEQTAAILQAVHQVLIFAVSCLYSKGVTQQTHPIDDDDLKIDSNDVLPTFGADTKANCNTTTTRTASSSSRGLRDLRQEDLCCTHPSKAAKEPEDPKLYDCEDEPSLGATHFEPKPQAGLNLPLSLLSLPVNAIKSTTQQTTAARTTASTTTTCERPIGGKHFENTLEVDEIKTEHKPNDFEDAKINILSTDLDLLRGTDPDIHRNEKKLWIFLLSNSPEPLVSKYPELRALHDRQHFLGARDGQLSGLKTTELNGKRIILRGYSEEKKRFIVQLFYLKPIPKKMLLKDENILGLKARPVSTALSRFKKEIGNNHWNKLTLGGNCLKNGRLLASFISHQMPYDIEMTDETGEPYDLLCDEALSQFMDQGLSATNSDCQIMISFLYTLCYWRSVHIIRRFTIPCIWKVQKWKGRMDLLLPLPT